ncbi:LapA family protein [Aurantiacibacter luteus]|uniref:LapA family protein n=1 Tax=Aurantiacibacter luteus TaxID=1581420 RepID=UPI000699983B|nr:LapA family protein [Aurantiacibacter luteus]
MQIVKTVIWVLLLVALLLFSLANWDPTVTVRIWDGIVVDTKIPAIVIVSFLIGFVPMWLFYRGTRWRLQRKVASLENAARTAAVTPVAHGGALDADRDGIPDRADPHPLTPDGTVTTPTRTDRDGDGVPDAVEADPPATSGATTGPGTYRAPGA